VSSWRPVFGWLAACAVVGGLLCGAPAGALQLQFDLPASASASQSPPYPNVATLTLTETADGVQFVLDPNQASPGFSACSILQRLDLVYAGPALDASDFRNDAGVAGSFHFDGNPHDMDAGYTADVFHIVVDFATRHGHGFDPGDTSTWTVLGATLADFSSFATASAKPTPVFGVISVAGYSLPGPHPTPSNWVAVVPEPGTVWLLAAGLGGLALRARRRTG
jgi:hypothetical protein